MRKIITVKSGTISIEEYARIVEALRRERDDLSKRCMDYAKLLDEQQRQNEELKAKLEKAKWRDIRTAPKDGTRIITWNKIDGAKENYMMQSTGWQGKWGHSPTGKEPTHWMPLPDAPEQR